MDDSQGVKPARTSLEEQLRQAERRFHAAFENPAVGVAIVGLNGTFLRVNHYLCQLTGYSEQELRARTFSEVTHPDDVEIGVNHLRRLLRRELLSCAFEKRYVRKDGQHVWLLVSPSLLLDEQDNALHFITQFQDLTEAKLAETARKEAEDRFRVYIDHSPDGLLVVDEQGRYIDANRAACELVGFSREELLQRSIGDLVPSDQRARATGSIRELDEKGEYRRETSLLAKNGKLVPIDLYAVRLSGSGQRYMALCRDIRPRLAAERERAALRAELDLARRLEALGLLAGGVAHDFNNLLASILGNAELAKRELPTDESCRGSLDAIGVAALRAAELCTQLLDYAGRGQAQVGTVDLSELAREAPEILAASTLADAQIIFELSAGVTAMRGDATQLRQVVMNLVSNACEALPSGQGTILLSTGHCELGPSAVREGYLPSVSPGSYVYLEVADDGVGMSEATLASMFDPFFTTKFTGRGLGLAALHGIVRSHGGCLRVKSSVGEGTTIRVLFPVSTGSDDGVPCSASAASGSPRLDRP